MSKTPAKVPTIGKYQLGSGLISTGAGAATGTGALGAVFCSVIRDVLCAVLCAVLCSVLTAVISGSP